MFAREIRYEDIIPHFFVNFNTVLDKAARLLYNTFSNKKEEKQMDQKKIDRINELARASRVRELTEEEKAEQKALREEYIIAYRASLRGILDNTVIERPDGSRESLKKK